MYVSAMHVGIAEMLDVAVMENHCPNGNIFSVVASPWAATPHAMTSILTGCAAVMSEAMVQFLSFAKVVPT